MSFAFHVRDLESTFHFKRHPGKLGLPFQFSVRFGPCGETNFRRAFGLGGKIPESELDGVESLLVGRFQGFVRVIDTSAGNGEPVYLKPREDSFFTIGAICFKQWVGNRFEFGEIFASADRQLRCVDFNHIKNRLPGK